MNFNFPLLRPIRILLFPVSLVYIAIVFLRNWLFDKNIFKTNHFNLPIICVGNIAVGGTGKSPMVEYLVRMLKPHYQIATLSRGYKRKTTGYALAKENTTALEIGDEPMQFHLKFPDVAVAVGEERLEAIPQLLHDKPQTQAIVLDDAFQHRTVTAGLNIILTDYNNLYTRDWYLPTGDLRDEKRSVERASIIVVTKCPVQLSVAEKNKILEELSILPHQQVYFTAVKYGTNYHIVEQYPYTITADTEVLLVTGIANPAPLKKMLGDNCSTYYEMAYSDHHIFTIDDLNDITEKWDSISASQKIILTTEKDAVRLSKFKLELSTLPVFVIPIEIMFLFEEGAKFEEQVCSFIKDFKYVSN